MALAPLLSGAGVAHRTYQRLTFPMLPIRFDITAQSSTGVAGLTTCDVLARSGVLAEASHLIP